jgi:predicted CXXCH cytochrome family protein
MATTPNERPAGRAESATVIPAAAQPAAPLSRRTTWLALGACAAVVAVFVAYRFGIGGDRSTGAGGGTRPGVGASHVGAQVCATCHAPEHAGWRGSHHDLAMQVADAQTVLGDFSGAEFRHHGVTSTLFRRDGKPWVNTDGPEGKLADFEIKYTFGVTPLQQYLIELPGGRLQALGIAWDARPKEQGGQRWFHLYPDRKLKAGDPLHWTGIDQNWNYQCADCHSTNLKKGYDARTDSYHTTWSEIDVSCEACHGPGSAHVAWAKKEGDRRGAEGPGKGLPVALDERRGITWAIDSATGNARRSAPRSGVREIETCARCHSRRGQFSDDFVHGQPLAQTHRIALIEDGLYWPDGQQRDEVYNHGSFLQSRMFAHGVTCSDCHDPHSLKLRAPGNAVCAQCHSAAKYDGPQHSFHPAGSSGALCAACHMPTTTYMRIDPRHDHSLRIPRPDRSVQLGVPNACNNCHRDKAPVWAADTVQRWYGRTPGGYQRFAEAFAAAANGAADAAQRLREVAGDMQQPAIARASALARLRGDTDPATLALLRRSLGHSDETIRLAAASALSEADPVQRAQALPPLLSDPVRDVRMEAARALAGAPERSLAPADRDAFSHALAEYMAAQQFNAERPEAHLNLGMLHAERGDPKGAEEELRAALARDPTFAPATVNLADLYRSRSREAEARDVLRAGIARNPRDAALRYALGLALVRERRTDEALAALARAVHLAPQNPHYAYVYAVALHGVGRVQQAIALLERTQRRFPGNRNALEALIAFERDRGNRAAALRWAEALVAAAPSDAQARQVLQALQRP